MTQLDRGNSVHSLREWKQSCATCLETVLKLLSDCLETVLKLLIACLEIVLDLLIDLQRQQRNQKESVAPTLLGFGLK